MRHIAANALTVLIVIGLVLAGLVAWGVQVFKSGGPHADDRIVIVESGDTLAEISAKLAGEGVISDPAIFRLGARYRGEASKIRFGEYEIPARASMERVLAILVSGKSVQHFVTAPEGLTSWEVVAILRDEPLLTGEIPEVPQEGVLAPDTYSITRGETRAAVLSRMEAAQEKILDAAWAGRAEGLPVESKREALILASIIEKETGLPEERDQVASVFINRLKRGMRLQTDPTVIYGITRGEGPLGRGLTRSELQTRTDWNTYLIDGLPPTPIANPGKESILAAVRPAETDLLYFVADGDGGHVFARSLAEHNRNVAQWRRIEAERAKQ
jgi:UPF0755 protein